MNFVGAGDIDKNETDLNISENNVDNYDICQVENASHSGDGWLLIGGICSHSNVDLEDAFKKAMNKLKCRYAYKIIDINFS